MRNIFLILLSFISFHLTAQIKIASKVYPWAIANAKTTRASMMNGSGAILSKHQLFSVVVPSTKSVSFKTSVDDDEYFFIIKSGTVEVELNGIKRSLGKSSVVFLLPGDAVVFSNQTSEPVELYEMHARSNVGVNQERGKKAGPSFMMDWNEMKFKPHNHGGVRQLFDRQTAMLNRFDIHITTLNPRFNSHPPHTHKNEEIILMLDGEGDMSINGTLHRLSSGGLCYVGSMDVHNITNVSDYPITYFAIQWN